MLIPFCNYRGFFIIHSLYMSKCLLFCGQAPKFLLLCHVDEALFVADPVSKLDRNRKRVSHGSVLDQFLVGGVQFLLIT